MRYVISGLIITSFLSVWCLYASARKVEFTKMGLTLRLAQNTRVAKWASLVFFVFSTILFCSWIGIASGVLAAVTIWMMLASVVVLFAPFHKISRYHLITMVCVMILLEFVLTYMFK